MEIGAVVVWAASLLIISAFSLIAFGAIYVSQLPGIFKFLLSTLFVFWAVFITCVILKTDRLLIIFSDSFSQKAFIEKNKCLFKEDYLICEDR